MTTTKTQSNAQRLHSALMARNNCELSNNHEWFDKWSKTIDDIMDNAPSGSGFDNGTTLVRYNTDHIVFDTAFHHMDECGSYDGWTEHRVTVRPSFDGFNLSVSGRNRNDIKEYIGELFHNWLSDDD